MRLNPYAMAAFEPPPVPDNTPTRAGDNVFTAFGQRGRDLVAVYGQYPIALNLAWLSFFAFLACSAFSDGVVVTLDGISLLVDAMNKAGYGEPLYNLFIRFEVNDLKDLTREQYEPFAEALLDLVVGEFGL